MKFTLSKHIFGDPNLGPNVEKTNLGFWLQPLNKPKKTNTFWDQAWAQAGMGLRKGQPQDTCIEYRTRGPDLSNEQ